MFEFRSKKAILSSLITGLLFVANVSHSSAQQWFKYVNERVIATELSKAKIKLEIAGTKQDELVCSSEGWAYSEFQLAKIKSSKTNLPTGLAFDFRCNSEIPAGEYLDQQLNLIVENGLPRYRYEKYRQKSANKIFYVTKSFGKTEGLLLMGTFFDEDTLVYSQCQIPGKGKNLAEINSAIKCAELLTQAFKKSLISGSRQKYPLNPGTVNKESSLNLRYLAKKGDLEILRGVVTNPNTPTEILDNLLSNQEIISDLAISTKSESVIQKLVAKNSFDIDWALLQNPNISTSTVGLLLSRQQLTAERVTWIASNPAIPGSILRDWFDEYEESHESLAANPRCPADLLATLANSEDGNLRIIVARNINAPISVLRKLSEDDFSMLGLIENPSTPIDIILTAFESDEVREFAGRNPALPKNLFEIYLDEFYDLDDEARQSALISIAQHPLTDIELQREIAKSDSEVVRGGLARNPKIDLDILSMLLQDQSGYVRYLAASNPKIPA